MAWDRPATATRQVDAFGKIQSKKTVDQYIADKVAGDTPLRSIEVGTEDMGTAVGACDGFRLHVLQHPGVARRNEPAAGGDQSARNLRADVRRDGFEGTAVCPPQGKGEPARFSDRGNRETEALAGRRPIAPFSTSIWATSARWSISSIAWKAALAPSPATRKRRWACRMRSTIT